MESCCQPVDHLPHPDCPPTRQEYRGLFQGISERSEREEGPVNLSILRRDTVSSRSILLYRGTILSIEYQVTCDQTRLSDHTKSPSSLTPPNLSPSLLPNPSIISIATCWANSARQKVRTRSHRHLSAVLCLALGSPSSFLVQVAQPCPQSQRTPKRTGFPGLSLPSPLGRRRLDPLTMRQSPVSALECSPSVSSQVCTRHRPPLPPPPPPHPAPTSADFTLHHPCLTAHPTYDSSMLLFTRDTLAEYDPD